MHKNSIFMDHNEIYVIKKFTFITSDVRACVMFQFKCHVWIVDIRSLFVYDFLGLLSIWLLVVVLFKSLLYLPAY